MAMLEVVTYYQKKKRFNQSLCESNALSFWLIVRLLAGRNTNRIGLTSIVWLLDLPFGSLY